VLMRKDPPFDMEYLTSVWLLSQAEREGARVFNNPAAVRDHNEKLGILEFPHFIAPTLATASADARTDLTVVHPLQPFSIDAFDPGRPLLQGFDTDYAAALRARYRGETARIVRPTGDDDADDFAEDDSDETLRVVDAQAPFFVGMLPAPPLEWRDVPIERLLRFFRNPSSVLIRERLLVALPEVPAELDDDEPFAPDHLTHWTVADRLLAQLSAGAAPDALRATARAGIEYPPGPLGDVLIDREIGQLAAFATAIATDSAGPLLPPVALFRSTGLPSSVTMARISLDDEVTQTSSAARTSASVTSRNSSGMFTACAISTTTS